MDTAALPADGTYRRRKEKFAASAAQLVFKKCRQCAVSLPDPECAPALDGVFGRLLPGQGANANPLGVSRIKTFNISKGRLNCTGWKILLPGPCSKALVGALLEQRPHEFEAARFLLTLVQALLVKAKNAAAQLKGAETGQGQELP